MLSSERQSALGADPRDSEEFDEPDERSDTDANRRRLLRRLAAGFGVLLVLAIAASVAGGLLADPPPSREISYTIPLGTVERLQAGEDVSVLPDTIELTTADWLVIRNDDHESFLFGNFTIRAGETFKHRYSQPGDYTADCTLHQSGAVKVLVTRA